MSIEKLRELLESGAITQDEFDTMAKAIEVDTEPTPDPDPEPTPDPEPDDKAKDDAASRIKQAELDRLMAKERKEKAELKRKLERMESKYLSEEQKRQKELEEREAQIAEQQREIQLEKNKMYAVRAMAKAEINNSEKATLIMEKLVLACEDETEIDDIVELLKEWKEEDVAAEVNKRFKEGGHIPKKSDTLNGGVNPWKQETFNLTEQIRIATNNPELAAQLKAAAGVN